MLSLVAYVMVELLNIKDESAKIFTVFFLFGGIHIVETIIFQFFFHRKSIVAFSMS
jgi:hypothetical protein